MRLMKEENRVILYQDQISEIKELGYIMISKRV